MRLIKPTDSALGKVKRTKAKWLRKQRRRIWLSIDLGSGDLCFHPYYNKIIKKGAFVFASTEFEVSIGKHDYGHEILLESEENSLTESAEWLL